MDLGCSTESLVCDPTDHYGRSDHIGGAHSRRRPLGIQGFLIHETTVKVFNPDVGVARSPEVPRIA